MLGFCLGFQHFGKAPIQACELLGRKLFVAQRAVNAVLRPLFDTLGMKVVPRIAGKRSDAITFLKVAETDRALFVFCEAMVESARHNIEGGIHDLPFTFCSSSEMTVWQPWSLVWSCLLRIRLYEIWLR